MAKAPVPPINERMLDERERLTRIWSLWYTDRYKQDGGQSGLDVYPLFYLESTITAAALDGALTVTLHTVKTGDQYKVREIFVSGDGTNFGAGGDRNLAIQDSSGTRIYTVITNALLESLTATRWGGTGVPFPTTAATLFAATTAGENIVAKYSGGTTDHSGTGSIKVLLVLEKIN